RRRRDVVLVDQRGTGRSNPLSMPTKKTPQHYVSEMYPVEYVKNLRQTLEQRADLTQYTTSIAMDDLDDARAWLGYDRIHLLGTSYGTRAALVYMRQHPERVCTATLIGVAPTYLKMPTYHAQAGARAMDLLLQQCEQDAQCHAAFPQIGDDWTNVLAQLERQPARVEYSLPDKSGPEACVHRGKSQPTFASRSPRTFRSSFFPATWIRLHRRSAAKKSHVIYPIVDMSSFRRPAMAWKV